MPGTETANSWRDRLTPLEVRARLGALAVMVRWRPSLRHHLRDVLPLGDELVHQGVYQFADWDGTPRAHVVFGDGTVRAHGGGHSLPDVTLCFREPRHMRGFFGGGDPLNMLLRNELKIVGNQAYLLRFGAVAADVLRGGKPVPRNTTLWSASGDDDREWPEVAVPPVGEPCRDTVGGESVALEDPYLADLSLRDLPRVRHLLGIHRHVQPELCPERARLLTEFVVADRRDPSTVDQTPALRRARAIHHVLSQRRAIVHDDDLLGGSTSSKRVGVVIYPETFGATIWPELLTAQGRELNPYRVDPADAEVLSRQVFPLWMDGTIREWTRRTYGNPTSLQLDERFVLYFQWKGYAVSHTIIDVPRVLRRGLRDIAAEARRRGADEDDAVRRQQYEAMALALDGVMGYTAGIAEEAGRQARRAEDPGAEARLSRIAGACERVPAEPPETLFEAVQAIWLLFLCQHQENVNAGLSLGRLDVWLQPYLERDLAGAGGDPDRRRAVVLNALETVCALMLKCTDHLPLVPDIGARLFGGSSSDQVITLGGQTAGGGDAVNDMTWIFLKATEMLRLRDPNVNARYAAGINSEAYLRRLCEVNLLTRATPSLHNDHAVIGALLEQGFTPEHARDWSATGCVEPTSCGRHFGHTGCLMFNLVAPLEMALHDGIHPVLGEGIGPRTGDPRVMTSYEQFRDVYLQQLGWLIDRAAECNNMFGEAHRQLMPSPLLSALFDGPMQSGRDVIDGGAIYNSTGVANVGLTDVIDSLCAIKTLVFDDRVVDMVTLLEALEADFEGHDVLEARLTHKVPKFGQDHPLPNAVACEVLRFIYDRWQAQPHYRGGRYVPGYWSMSNHVAFGRLSGALPSGRRRGVAFTPGLTPSPRCGAPLTTKLRNVAALPARLMPNNIAFNVRVVPMPGDDHATVVGRMAALVGAYMDSGGMQMQFNVVDGETLRAAMDSPADHRDLLVRISGYNAYFVELNHPMQIELIERTEHRLGEG